MNKIIILLIFAVELSGCAQIHQNDLKEQAQISECATKYAKIANQQDFQQALQECRYNAMIEKKNAHQRAMNAAEIFSFQETMRRADRLPSY